MDGAIEITVFMYLNVYQIVKGVSYGSKSIVVSICISFNHVISTCLCS